MSVENILKHKIDALVVFGSANRQYFSEITTSSGCVIVTSKKKYFLTDFRYQLYAESALSVDFELIITNGQNDVYTKIRDILKSEGLKNVGFEDDTLSFSDYKTLKAELEGFTLKPASAFIKMERAVKTDREIEKMMRAQEICENAFDAALNYIKAGMTEREAASELVYQLIRKGSGKLPFEPIIASGANAARPHHSPSDREIEKNETVLFDFGASFEGYACDMSRTFVFGTPPKEIEKIYNHVIQAQAYALKNIKAGMTAGEADSFAREFLKSNGYGDNFRHSLGHGVGLDVHEYPRVGEGSNEILLPNMVITIEPGIYIEGLGGVRIEDMVVVKENGIQNLTFFHKDIHS